MLAPRHSSFPAHAGPFRPLSATPSGDPRAARRPPLPAPAVSAILPGALRRAEHLPRRLREALAVACEDRRGIRTVEKLAAAAGCDRRTLWTHWKHSAAARHGLRLEDFLHWLILLRAMQRKTGALAWADVADEIGIHPHTLGRLARQLTGSTLRDLAAQGHSALASRFETQVVAPLLTPAPDPAGR